MNRFDRGGSSLGKNVDIMDGNAVVGWLNGFWKRRLERLQTQDLLFAQKAVTATKYLFYDHLCFFTRLGTG